MNYLPCFFAFDSKVWVAEWSRRWCLDLVFVSSNLSPVIIAFSNIHPFFVSVFQLNVRAMNGYQVSGTLLSCLNKILNFFFGICSQTGQHFEILLLILTLPNFVFLQWDLFINWSAFGVCATISFDQFENRSH